MNGKAELDLSNIWVPEGKEDAWGVVVVFLYVGPAFFQNMR